MSDVSTPLHPEAVHRHSVTKADGGCICYGWDDAGNRYKIWVHRRAIKQEEFRKVFSDHGD